MAEARLSSAFDFAIGFARLVRFRQQTARTRGNEIGERREYVGWERARLGMGNNLEGRNGITRRE